MTRQLRVFAAALLLAGATVPAHGQHPPDAGKIRAGLALGCGSLRCDLGCTYVDGRVRDDRASAITGLANVGWRLRQRLWLGMEASRWVKEVPEVRLRLSAVGAVLDFYPAVDGGLHFKGGIGIAAVRLSGHCCFDIGLNESSRGGFATLGAAYDIRLVARLSISPGLSVMGGTFYTDFSDLLSQFTARTLDLEQLTLALTWR